MNPPRERDIERACVKLAQRAGVLTRKLVAPPAGWPDRIFCLPGGRTWWVEFKRPKARLTTLQHARVWELIDAGHDVVVVDDVAFFAEQLKYRLTKPEEGGRVRGSAIPTRKR